MLGTNYPLPLIACLETSVVEGPFVPIFSPVNPVLRRRFSEQAAPAAAQDVQGGIAAWQAGDYAKAVTEWRPLADSGNADAQFNLAQAYRLGRGVPQNLNLAEQWFERAARQRHEQAGASLGLLLFQNGRAREAMPWIQAAAMRGDPRAQYVFGTALFNGDVLRRDLPRAYAMMSAAAAQGFPQAQPARREERQLTQADRDRCRALMSRWAPRRPPYRIGRARVRAAAGGDQPRPRTRSGNPASGPVPNQLYAPPEMPRDVSPAPRPPSRRAPPLERSERADRPIRRLRSRSAPGRVRNCGSARPFATRPSPPHGP